MGIDPVWAENGLAGVAALENDQDFDFILLDIKMPGIDGFETLKRIRAIDSEIKVIAQTAYAMKSDENKIREAGFDDYLAKPIKLEAFTSMVEKSLTPIV
jgi:CheY-like chemotaxis protein